MAKKDFNIDEYREHMITSLTALKSDVRHIKDTLIDQRILLRKQNDRVRKNERNIARIFGIGSTIMAVFSGIIAWLFNK